MEKRRVLLPLEACQPSSPRSSDAILNGFGTGLIDDYEPPKAAFGSVGRHSRRHSVRKVSTSSILGINSGHWGQNMSNIGKSVSENGDPMVTYG